MVQLAEKCPKLKHLNVACTKIGDESLEALAKHCSQLQTLYAARCKKLTREGLFFIVCHCPNLTELKISYFDLEDEDVIFLCYFCLGLKRINTVGTKVTPAGRAALKATGITDTVFMEHPWQP